jgi:hypothetical protein
MSAYYLNNDGAIEDFRGNNDILYYLYSISYWIMNSESSVN